MVYTTTFIPQHGPILITPSPMLRSREIIAEEEAKQDGHFDKYVDEGGAAAGFLGTRITRHIGGVFASISRLFSLGSKKRAIEKKVTRRHLAMAQEQKVKDEQERRRVSYYATPFVRALKITREKRKLKYKLYDNVYNLLWPEFNGVFEESFYNSFLRLKVEVGGIATGTYGAGNAGVLTGTAGMAVEPFGVQPLLHGYFEEEGFKGEIKLEMDETGTAFYGEWYHDDGKFGGRWEGIRRRTWTEWIMRSMYVHWLIPRRSAPASWVEEVAAVKMQSAFRGHLSRVDLGLVQKQLHAEALENMARSGSIDMLPGAKKGWGKAKRNITAAALAGAMSSISSFSGDMPSGGGSGSMGGGGSGEQGSQNSQNFGALFAAKRAQLKGETADELTIDEVVTEGEALAAKALADDHLASLADDNMRHQAHQGAMLLFSPMGVFGAIRSIFSRRKRDDDLPPGDAADGEPGASTSMETVMEGEEEEEEEVDPEQGGKKSNDGTPYEEGVAPEVAAANAMARKIEKQMKEEEERERKERGGGGIMARLSGTFASFTGRAHSPSGKGRNPRSSSPSGPRLSYSISGRVSRISEGGGKPRMSEATTAAYNTLAEGGKSHPRISNARLERIARLSSGTGVDGSRTTSGRTSGRFSSARLSSAKFGSARYSAASGEGGGRGSESSRGRDSQGGRVGKSLLSTLADTQDDSVGTEMPVWLWYLRIKATVNFIMIVYEVINMWSFVFSDPVPWPASEAKDLFRWATGDIRGELFPGFFFFQWTVYAGLFGFWLIDIFIVPPKLEKAFADEVKELLKSADSFKEFGKALDRNSVPAMIFEIFTGIKRLLLEGFYMPTMVSCFNMLHCKYPGTGKPYLAVYPEKLCWTGFHFVEALMAGSLVAVLYVTTLYVSCSVKPYHASLYRWDPLFEARFLMSKALSCGLATLGIDAFGGRLQIYVLAVNLCQLLYSQFTQQPTRGRAQLVNNLRTSAFAVEFLGAICAIALLEGPREGAMFPESIGMFYALAVCPVFLTTWYVNNDQENGRELPDVDLIELLKMELDENGILRTPDPKDLVRVVPTEAPVGLFNADGGNGVVGDEEKVSIVKRDHLTSTPGHMGIRVKVVASLSIGHLMLEDQNLKVVKRGVRQVLRMCGEDPEFHKVANSLLSRFFGKACPKQLKHNVFMKRSRLTLQEAQIIVSHLKRTTTIETCTIGSIYPLARIRRNQLKNFDLQAVALVNEMDLSDALILKELMRPVAKLTELKTVSVSGRMQMPVGALLEGEAEELRTNGAKITSGDLLLLSEYIRINHSLKVLDLSNAEIGAPGIEALCAAIRMQRTITTVNLSGNPIVAAANASGESGAKALTAFQQFGNAIGENVSVQSLLLHKIELPVSQIRMHKNQKRVKRLDLSNTSRDVLRRDPTNSLTDADVAVIARLLKGSRIDSLDLSGNLIGPNGAHQIGLVLKDGVGLGSLAKNVQLTELDLSGNKIGSTGCKTIGQSLRRNNSLKRLDLGDNKISIMGAHYVAACLSRTRPGEKDATDAKGRSAYLSALDTLILSENPIGPKGAESLAAHMGARGEHQAGRLTHLDLSHTAIMMEGGKALAQLLPYNNSLKVLDLSNSMLTESEVTKAHSDDALAAIGECLPHNVALERLILCENNVPSRGVHMIAEGLHANAVLQVLDLSSNRIGCNVQSMAEIVDLILADNTTLKHFIIAGNPVGPGVLHKVKQWEVRQEQKRLEREAAASPNASMSIPSGAFLPPGMGGFGGSMSGVMPGLQPDASMKSFALPNLPSMTAATQLQGKGPDAQRRAAAVLTDAGLKAPPQSVAGPYTANTGNPATTVVPTSYPK